MKGTHKLLSFILKFFLVIILIFGITFIGLVTYYFITKKSAVDYLPDTFLVYVKINSIKDLYENVLDLKAAETVFSEVPQLRPIHRAITDFKSEKLARSFYFKKLLDVEAHAVIDSSQTPVLIFDPGLLSLPIQLIPFANLFVKVEGINIDTIARGQVTLYAVSSGASDRAYFSINNNLIFVSTKQEPIERLYAIRESGNSLGKNEQAQALFGKIREKGKATILVKTDSLVGQLPQSDPILRSILSEVAFDGYSGLTFDISNSELSIEAVSGYQTKNDTLLSFVSFSPPGQKSLTLLPDTASIYSSVNTRNLKDLVRLISAFKERDEEKLVKQIDDACNLLFRKSADELVYSWFGSEAGVVTLETSETPVVFIRVKDTLKFNEAVSAIAGALLLSEESNLVLDGERLTKIVIPDFLRGIVNVFVKGIDAPYYLMIGDYVFFSMDPGNLSNISISARSRKTIVHEEDFKKLTKSIPMNAHVSLYYNIEGGVPDILSGNRLISKLLSSYKQGIVSVFFRENEARVRVMAEGIQDTLVSPCPGYPRPLPGGTATDVIVRDVWGSRAPELVYASRNGKLVILNPADGSAKEADIEPESVICAVGREIYALSGSGILNKLDGEANPVPPFPLASNFKGTFLPLEMNGRLVLFSQSESALVFIDREGNESKLNFPFEQPLLTQPGFASGIIAFYPKGFAGTVYCTGPDGTVLPGWPKDGDGISYTPPLVFANKTGRPLVAFITQAGKLSVWDGSGNALAGFPVDLGGVYVADIVTVSSRIIAGYAGTERKVLLALNTDGDISVVDLGGTVLLKRRIQYANGKGARLALFDYNRDGIEEIFTYGSSNYINGLSQGLATIPGFPVKGSGKIAFEDVNADGRTELVSGSFDGNVYAYTLGG